MDNNKVGKCTKLCMFPDFNYNNKWINVMLNSDVYKERFVDFLYNGLNNRDMDNLEYIVRIQLSNMGYTEQWINKVIYLMGFISKDIEFFLDKDMDYLRLMDQEICEQWGDDM